MSTPTIIDDLGPGGLFENMFDAPSWKPWRVFLASLFGLPMSADDLTVFQHHTARHTPPTVPFREAALVCGRRGGKSRILALVAVWLACRPDYGSVTAPGETPVVAIIAKDRKQAQVILNYIVGLMRAVPVLDAMILDVLAETVRLDNGVVIEVHSGSVGAPRGRTFIAVLADEIAFWSTGDAANPDTEVIAAVRPGLASIPTSMLLMASSPYARRGVLFDRFARYYGRDDAKVLVWRGTTIEMNSGIDRGFIEDEFAADPDHAAAEYNAEFRTDITAFISRDAIEVVVAKGVHELPPGGGINYVGFVDPSGGSADSFTLAIAHLGHDNVAILDAVREVRPPFSPDDVTAEYCALLKSYGVTRVVGDGYAGEWPRERFAAHGISYDPSDKTKNVIYGEFLPALNGRRLRLLDNARLIGQFCALERRVARGGRDSIDHQPGAHDDIANAAAGALTLVISDRAPRLVPQEVLATPGAPLELRRCTQVFAVVVAGQDGRCAVLCCAEAKYYQKVPLAFVDVALEPLSPDLLRSVGERLQSLALVHGAQHGPPVVWAFEPLDRQIRRCGVPTSPIPAELQDVEALALLAAGHLQAGDVKLAPGVLEKAKSVPFRAAVDLKLGVGADDPLRAAVILAIALAIPNQYDLLRARRAA